MSSNSTSKRKFAVVQGGGGSAGASLLAHPMPPAPSQPVHDDWAALARAAALGDPRAIRTFLAGAGPHILRVVRRFLGSYHPDVEDVAQECAFAVIDALPSFRGECSAMHFVCRVALLTAMNRRRLLRAAKRAEEPEGTDALDSVQSPDDGPEQLFSSRVTASIVRELLETLPIEQAQALALHCVLGHTLVEMAESSGLSPDTWKSRLRLAKNAFRNRVLADRRALELFGLSEGESR